MKIFVIGAGYVGLVQSAGLAKLGHEIVCMDVDAEKIKRLEAGEIPFHEPGLSELVKEGIAAGQLAFTTDVSRAADAEIVFLAVGTPSAGDGRADLTYLESAARSLAPHLSLDAIVVTKSTVPVGTGEKVAEWCGIDDARVASNPEFLREGSAVHDFFHPDRIVIGGDIRVAEVYQGIETKKIFVSRRSAELAKYAANTMLAMRLSLMNEYATIADATGADILDIESVLATDPRIGDKFLRAGAGFGGSCFPKDVLALAATAHEHGYDPRLIAPIIQVNHEQAERFVAKIEKRLGRIQGKHFAVWGLAFNKNTDDVRESPAIRIVHLLLDRGATIAAYDPAAMDRARAELGDRIRYAVSTDDTLTGAECLLVLAPWPTFYEQDWATVLSRLKHPLLFDGKNLLPTDAIVAAGGEVMGMGVWKKPSDRS